MRLRSGTYKLGRLLGDWNAVKSGRIAARIFSRILGRIAGLILRSLLR